MKGLAGGIRFAGLSKPPFLERELINVRSLNSSSEGALPRHPRRWPADRRRRSDLRIRRAGADGRPRPGFDLRRLQRCLGREYRQRCRRTHHTTLRGDLGVKANAQPTGFPPGVVTGTTRVGAAADQAHADLVAAYTDVATRTGAPRFAGALAGQTVTPGLHTITGAASNTTTVTLDGEGHPNSVFVFQVGGALTFAAASEIEVDQRCPGVPGVLAGKRRRAS